MSSFYLIIGRWFCLSTYKRNLCILMFGMALAILLTGCPGTTPAPQTTPPSFSEQVRTRLEVLSALPEAASYRRYLDGMRQVLDGEFGPLLEFLDDATRQRFLSQLQIHDGQTDFQMIPTAAQMLSQIMERLIRQYQQEQ